MKRGQKHAKFSVYVSCIFMMLALVWLTVSLPFVNAAKQQVPLSSVHKTSSDNNDEKDSGNPFANTTEEKTSSSVNTLSEEYLHDTHSTEEYFSVPSTEYKVEHASIYVAFHGELISPPPDLS